MCLHSGHMRQSESYQMDFFVEFYIRKALGVQ
jgi:hypothetical protein